jgi:hypothetical protein
MNDEKRISIKEKIDNKSKVINILITDFLADNLPAYESLKENEEIRLKYDLIVNGLITNLFKIIYGIFQTNPNFITESMCWDYIKKVVDEDFESDARAHADNMKDPEYRKMVEEIQDRQDAEIAEERLNNPGPRTSLDDMEKDKD